MHEMTIAMNIVDIVCQKADEEKAVKVNSVDLVIGELSGVMIDSLEFCFEAACKNTIADGAELNIYKINAEELIKGKEFSIKSFNID
jgi:hydrogenase nickel incorporation protein HypA/HybF